MEIIIIPILCANKIFWPTWFQFREHIVSNTFQNEYMFVHGCNAATVRKWLCANTINLWTVCPVHDHESTGWTSVLIQKHFNYWLCLTSPLHSILPILLKQSVLFYHTLSFSPGHSADLIYEMMYILKMNNFNRIVQNTGPCKGDCQEKQNFSIGFLYLFSQSMDSHLLIWGSGDL